MDQKEFENIIKETVAEVMKESDLIAPPMQWNEMKNQLKNNIAIIIKNIENDNYTDAEGVLATTIGLLRLWKNKIKIGTAEKPEPEYQEPFSKFGLRTGVLDEKN